MITPKEIQDKEFSITVRGYKQEDVDMFLDALTLDWDKLLLENSNLVSQVKRLKGEIERYKLTEEGINNTLKSARDLMNDISESAEKRAAYLLKNAELDAEMIVREAKENVEKLNEEYSTLKNKVESFNKKFKNLLTSELKRLDTMSSELFEDMEFDGLGDIKSVTDIEDLEQA